MDTCSITIAVTIPSLPGGLVRGSHSGSCSAPFVRLVKFVLHVHECDTLCWGIQTYNIVCIYVLYCTLLNERSCTHACLYTYVKGFQHAIFNAFFLHFF